MKTCSKCSLDKPVADFEGDRSTCRDCRLAYQRDWYQRNRQQHIANVKARRPKYRDEVGEVIREAKSMPCVDCGQSYPPYVMDFDHLRDKALNVADAAKKRWSARKVRAEIEKCEVVCANCHRERTHRRRLLGVTGNARA